MRASNSVVGSACVAGLILSLATPVLADDQTRSTSQASPRRVVMQCEADDMTRRAYVREFRAEPVFVTAREVRSARASGQAWSAPRCMTAREHARLVQSMGDQASAVR